MAFNPLKVALIGFDGPHQASLELYLSRHDDDFELVPEQACDAIIYNADQPVAFDQQQREYTEKYDKPGVVVSINEVSWPEMVFLQKPYSMEMLNQALQQLQQIILDSAQPAKDSEAYLQQVLQDFRSSMRRGQGDTVAQDDNKPSPNQRHSFQNELFKRKRLVQAQQPNHQTPDAEVATSWADVLAQHETKTIKQANNFDEDLLSVTEEVTAGYSAEQDLRVVQQVPLLLDPTVQDIQDCCGNLADANLRDAAQRRNLFFNPDGQLFALVAEARRRGRREQHPVAVVGLPNQHLQYIPQTDQFVSNIDYQVLMQMAHVRFRFGELQLQVVGDDDQSRKRTDFVQYGAEQMIWQLACYSSKGRLIEGISLQQPYKLKAELPSYVILDLPRTSAIIKLWQNEALSVTQLMDRLHVEQRFVFPFMTAAYSLDWLLES